MVTQYTTNRSQNYTMEGIVSLINGKKTGHLSAKRITELLFHSIYKINLKMN